MTETTRILFQALWARNEKRNSPSHGACQYALDNIWQTARYVKAPGASAFANIPSLTSDRGDHLESNGEIRDGNDSGSQRFQQISNRFSMYGILHCREFHSMISTMKQG